MRRNTWSGALLVAAVLALMSAAMALPSGVYEFSDQEVLTASAVDSEPAVVSTFQSDMIAVSEALSAGGSVDDVSALATQPAVVASSQLARAWPYGRGRNYVLKEPRVEGPVGFNQETENQMGPVALK